MGAVVLFDGVCNFCDSSVNFIIEHDKGGYFKFASLQSDEGRRLAAQYGFMSAVADANGAGDHLEPVDSVILVENGDVYTHSTATLKIARRLDGIWSLAYVLIVVPRFMRDFLYKLFAKRRYRLFSRKDHCMIPSPEIRARFLT